MPSASENLWQAYTRQVQPRLDREALAREQAQQEFQNNRLLNNDALTQEQAQRQRTQFEQTQQDRQSERHQQALARAAAIARNALKMEAPVRKGFLQRAIPQYAEDFKLLGADMADLPALMQQDDADLEMDLREVAGFGEQEQNRVQSAQILANGNIGYLTQDGRVVDTGQKAKEPLQLTDIGGAPAIANLRTATTTQLSTPEREREAAAAQAGAVAGAKATAENTAANAQAAVSNQRAYETYLAGMGNLEKRLNATQTDPITGRVVALTANAQAAEGAIASMAPVLKALFRQTGEGTFTDRDQAMLIEMLPTRKDHPEARKAKIESINAIVRAKLGTGQSAQAPAAPGGWSIKRVQ